jgi:hypothetical protein
MNHRTRWTPIQTYIYDIVICVHEVHQTPNSNVAQSRRCPVPLNSGLVSDSKSPRQNTSRARARLYMLRLPTRRRTPVPASPTLTPVRMSAAWLSRRRAAATHARAQLCAARLPNAHRPSSRPSTLARHRSEEETGDD